MVSCAYNKKKIWVLASPGAGAEVEMGHWHPTSSILLHTLEKQQRHLLAGNNDQERAMLVLALNAGLMVSPGSP